LAKSLDIAIGVQPQVALRARRSDQAFAFVFSKRLRMHLEEASGHADYEQRFIEMACHLILSLRIHRTKDIR
jgi:hypothetical protein